MPKRKKDRGLTGKPVIMDKLDPELGGKVVEAVIDDMDRAAERRRAKGAKGDDDAPTRRAKATKKRR